ncbi:hypothetical protein ACFY0A_42435 [Streptomyces sp. NPDC001698]
MKARPRSRCDNTAPNQADIPADNPSDNCPHTNADWAAYPQLTTPARP